MVADQSRPKVFDVGQPQALPTSRPVIVGHRPVMPDPMVNRAASSLPPSHAGVSVAPPQPQATIPAPAAAPMPAPQSSPPAPAVPVPPPAAPASLPKVQPIAEPAQVAPPSNPISQPHTAKIIPVSDSVQQEILTATKPLSTEKLSAESGAAIGVGVGAVPQSEVNDAFNVQAVDIQPNLPSLPVSHGSPGSGVRMKFMLIWLCVLAVVVFVSIFLAIKAGIVQTG